MLIRVVLDTEFRLVQGDLFRVGDPVRMSLESLPPEHESRLDALTIDEAPAPARVFTVGLDAMYEPYEETGREPVGPWVEGVVVAITGLTFVPQPVPGEPRERRHTLDAVEASAVEEMGDDVDPDAGGTYVLTVEVADDAALPADFDPEVHGGRYQAAAGDEAGVVEERTWGTGDLDVDECTLVLGDLADDIAERFAGSVTVLRADDDSGVSLSPAASGATAVHWSWRRDGATGRATLQVHVGDGEWTLPADLDGGDTVRAFVEAAESGRVSEHVRHRGAGTTPDADLLTVIEAADGRQWTSSERFAPEPVSSDEAGSTFVVIGDAVERYQRGEHRYAAWASAESLGHE